MPRANRERVYCLTRCGDGRWLVLNRRYKPVGSGLTFADRVDYERCEGTRLTLNDAQIQRAAHGCQPYRLGDRMFWIYSDVTRPERSPALCRAYRARLGELGL